MTGAESRWGAGRALLAFDPGMGYTVTQNSDNHTIWVVQRSDAPCPSCSIFVWLAVTAAAAVVVFTSLVIFYVCRQVRQLRAAAPPPADVHVNPSCVELAERRGHLHEKQLAVGTIERCAYGDGGGDIISPCRQPQSVIVLQY